MASETNGSIIDAKILITEVETQRRPPTLDVTVAVVGLTQQVNKSDVRGVIELAKGIGLKTIDELEGLVEVSSRVHVFESEKNNDNDSRSTNGSGPHEHSEAKVIPAIVGEPGKVRLIPNLSQNGDKSEIEKMSLILPKRVNTNSVKGNILRTLFREDIHCSTNDPRMVAEEVMRHFNTFKSIKSKELVTSTIDELIKSGHVVVAQNGSELYTVKVAENLIRIIDKKKRQKNLSKAVSFDFDGQSIVIDIKDIKEMSLEQLVLIRILQNTTYETSGISQNESLRNFIDSIDCKDKKDLQAVLDKLTNENFIALNGDNAKHLTPEGMSYILDYLRAIDALEVPKEELEEQEADKTIEESYREKGAIIFGPNKKGRKFQNVYADNVSQQEELSAETLTKLKNLEETIELDDPITLDAQTILLSLENKAETFQIVQKLHEITGWSVNAFLTTETKDVIPVAFTTKKEYDVEALIGSHGMVTRRFTLKIIGNAVSMTFNQNLTVKDIYDVKSFSDRLDRLYSENGKKSHELDVQTPHSKAVLYSGINNIVCIGKGKFAYSSGFSAPPPPASSFVE